MTIRKNQTKEDYNKICRERHLKRKIKKNLKCIKCLSILGINNKNGYCKKCYLGIKEFNVLPNLKRTLKWRKNISESKMGIKNINWKGDDVGLGSLHRWIERHKIKPRFCKDCKKNRPIDLANISQKYYRDVDDFEWLCRSCHMRKDGRIKNLKNAIK